MKRIGCLVIMPTMLLMALAVAPLHESWAQGKIPVAQSTSTQRILKNADIISLTKAGLSEAAIIALIKNSQSQFDLSAEALLALKKVGVANSVIEAMLGSHKQPTSPSGTPASTLPTAFGYYISDGARFIRLEPLQVTSKIVLSPGGSVGVGIAGGGIGLDGLSGDPTAKTRDATSTLIIYQQSADLSALHVAPLVYVRSMQAYQFNMMKTDPQFFASLYGRGYYDVIPIDLWRPSADLDVRIEPEVSKPGMYRVTPQSPLAPGRYALYFGDAMHKDGIIFGVQARRWTQATYFEIQPAGSAQASEGTKMASLTREIADANYFRERARVFSTSFDEAWAAANRVLLRDSRFQSQDLKIATADRGSGVLVTAPTLYSRMGKTTEFRTHKRQYALVFERLGERSTKVSVKGFCYAQKGKNEWILWSPPDSCSDWFLRDIEKELQQASKETASAPPPSQPGPKSSDIESRKQKLNDFIIDQWRQVVQIPSPKRSLKALIALKITGKYDDYSSLYLLGVNRRNLASDALKTAEKFLRKGNLETAQKYASLATRHYAESNQLFNSAEQIFVGSVGMTAQALDGIYRATREASVYGWSLMCGPKCYEIADYAFLMTDFAVDYSLEGMDEAQKNLFAKSLVKALLSTGGVTSWVEKRTAQVIGSSGLYNLLDKTLNAPSFQKALMKVLAESGAYATKRLVTSQLQKAIQEDANKIIDASRNFVRDSSNLEPTQTTNVASSSAGANPSPVGLYQVTTSAAVYEKPNQKARRIATIQPGTRVNVINVMGDWLEIRSRHERPPGFIRKNSAVPVKE